VYLDIPTSRPNKIDLETKIQQKVIELTASSLPGRGYRILLVSAVESDSENIGKFTVLASWKGKKLLLIFKEKIALGNLVAPFKFSINDWLQVSKSKPFLKSGIFRKKTNFQFVNRPPLHLFKTIGCWIILFILYRI
jgi:hypothetical protein